MWRKGPACDFGKDVQLDCRPPNEAAQQTGFEGGRDDFLDTLDHAFYVADEAAPMENLLARWIASWPDLQVVDSDDYDDVIHRLVMANPKREAGFFITPLATWQAR
ncbi:hypothetical protein [Mesorhizobium sp. M0676]|uniref:hypothetical protein n=1 Tax=Mesorhizobium sp. M0676 TaxID=2956984 RepID=UPI00333B0E2B